MYFPPSLPWAFWNSRRGIKIIIFLENVIYIIFEREKYHHNVLKNHIVHV